MTIQEYNSIQRDLNNLIDKLDQEYRCCSKYRETAINTILRCKSVLSKYNPEKQRAKNV